MSKVKFLYQQIIQNFPRRHALAIVGVSTGTLLALSLMPDKSADANDHRKQSEQHSLFYPQSSPVTPADSEIKAIPPELISDLVVAKEIVPDLVPPDSDSAVPMEHTQPAISEQPQSAPALAELAEVAALDVMESSADGIPSPEDAPFTAAKPEPIPELVWKEREVRKGDTLSGLFSQSGIPAKTLIQVIQTSSHGKLLADIRPGQTISMGTLDGKLKMLKFERSPLEIIEYTLSEDGQSYNSRIITRKPEVEHAYATATISNSLFLAAANAGVPDSLIMNLANIFGWDIDFVMDIREGDSFSLIYEEKHLGDVKVGHGNILAATFTNQGKTYQAVYYSNGDGIGDYYSPDGKSMRKSFLRTPVEFTRISSKFNPNRLHPIFKTRRPHRGVDYAAPTGTPIKASGDGVINYSGWKSGYGNVVLIDHPNDITTVYAHQSRLAGFRKGQKVKQGDIIGYVGQTGWATGPHLHYEFQVRGVHRNPLTVKLPDAEPLPKVELAKFQRLSATLMAELDKQSVTLLASAKDSSDVSTQ